MTEPTSAAGNKRQTQVMRGRPVTNTEAFEAAHRLIASAFNRTDVPRARFCIPTQVSDDDVVLTDYLAEADAEAKHARALRDCLKDAADRMDRARFILMQNGGNWGMLDTSNAREVLTAYDPDGL